MDSFSSINTYKSVFYTRQIPEFMYSAPISAREGTCRTRKGKQAAKVVNLRTNPIQKYEFHYFSTALITFRNFF